MREKLEEIISINAIFDMRVETLAATLLKQADGKLESFGLEQIVIAPKGGDRRRVGQDVERIRQKTYDDEHTVLMLEINRKGLFDTLPIGLLVNVEEDFTSPKQRTRAIAKQIATARKFFLPYELASYHPRITADQLEQKYTETFPQFIVKLWGLDRFSQLLNDRQRFLLCYLIPEAYRIVGNLPFTRLIFEAVLKNQVQLNRIAPLTIKIPPRSKEDGADLTLGEDAVLGDEFKDDIPALEVCVYNIKGDEIEAYLQDGQKRQLLENLLFNYFLPLEEAVITRIEVRHEDFISVLDEAILGYNLSLS